MVISDKGLCSGCGACKSVCPKDCISFKEDDNITAVIDKEKCIDCGLCRKVCPILKKESPKAYAAYSLDEELVMKSASGGMFSVFAESILEKGGVVFGAAFDENFEVHHIAIETKEDLDKLRRSKYVRSRIENCFEEVASYLDSERTVLFTGTSCQTEGLLSYLSAKNIDTSLLYTQDLICHGTVLPSVWKKYLSEKKKEYNSEIKDISFRNKKYSWNKQGISIEFENGMEYFAKWSDDIYMKIFLNDYLLCESCYNCKYRGKRKSDITIADFWGISAVDPDACNKYGTSAVIINTPKGEELFSSVKEKIFCKEENFGDIIKYNQIYYTTVKKPKERQQLLEKIDEFSLDELYKICVEKNPMGFKKQKPSRLKEGKKEIVIFGAGQCLNDNLDRIRNFATVRYVADNNSSKWGKKILGGLTCISPDEILKIDNAYVLIAIENPKIAFTVASQLLDMKITDFDYIHNWFDYAEKEDYV